jgi:hypothetical protein
MEVVFFTNVLRLAEAAAAAARDLRSGGNGLGI